MLSQKFTPFLIADIGCVSSEESALTKFTPFLIVDSAEQVRFIIPEEKTCPRACVDILPSSIVLRKDYYLLLLAPHSGALVCECFSDPIPSNPHIALCVLSSLISVPR